MTVRLSTLSNGLRIASDTMAGAESVVLGVWVGVGTRHEPWTANGIAHMTEHMLFKGTEKRSAYALGAAIEKNGGAMNAYTTREETAFFARVLPEDAPLAADIVSDMVLRSRFDPRELDRERQVILQEISRDKELPEYRLDDLMHATAFPEQKIGRPILGKTGVVERLSREHIMRYVKNHYHTGNLVLIGAGKISHEELLELARSFFSDIPKGRPSKMDPAQIKSSEVRKKKDCEQLHLMLSFPAPGLHSPRAHVAELLGCILGGNTSSRLFQKVREKRGLVYHVSATHTPFRDTGLFNIYAGADPLRVKELIPVICHECRDVCERITSCELRRAKAQLRADTLMGQESVMRRAETLGHQMLAFGRPFPLEKELKKITKTSAEETQAMAASLFSQKPILTVLGETKAVEPYRDLIERLS